MTVPDINRIAARVCWFKSASETLADESDFLCRVMQWATWEDAAQVMLVYGVEKWRRALAHAPPGVLDQRSWAFWTRRLDLQLPLPTRKLPHDAAPLLPA
jgi:hypothetical protein